MRYSWNLGSALFGAAGIVFAAGCATSHTFKVDAISNPEAEKVGSYHIVTGNSRIAEEDPQFQEMAAYVKTALSGKGYHEAPNAEEAELVIEVDYGTNRPQIDFKTVTGDSGGGLDRTGRTYTGPGSSIHSRGVSGRGRNVSIERDDTEYIPVTTYEKYLRLIAWENQDGVEPEDQTQVWQVTVKTKDDQDDMEKYLPLLVAASIAYVGEDTDSQEKIVLKETDDDVVFVKKGM